jgi:hypothetical protein
MENEAKIIRLDGLSECEQESVNKHDYAIIGGKLFISRERVIEIIKNVEKINDLEVK